MAPFFAQFLGSPADAEEELTDMHFVAKKMSDSFMESSIMRDLLENPSHQTVGALYNAVDDSWMYCLTQSTWYHCINGMWYDRGRNPCPEHYTTFQYRVVDVVGNATKFLNTELFRAVRSGNDAKKAEGKKIEGSIKQLLSLTKKLGDVTFMDKTVKCMAQHYMKQNVLEMLDQNVDIFCFNNTVFELETGMRRNLSSVDYIQTTTGYDYEQPTEERIAETEAVIRNMFPDDKNGQKEYEHLLNLLAYSLSGARWLELFVILVGVGSNGKSILADMVKKTFGNYFAVMPVSYLTQKRGKSGSACPELANKKGKRALWASESEIDERWNCSKIKELSDTLETRKLFGNPFEFRPQATLWAMSNNDPTFSCMDNGVTRRYRGVEFNVVFQIPPEKEKAEAEKIEEKQEAEKVEEKQEAEKVEEKQETEKVEEKQETEKADDENKPKVTIRVADAKLRQQIEEGYYQHSLFVLLWRTYGKNLRGRKNITLPPSSKTYTQEIISANDTVKNFVENYLDLNGDNDKNKVTAKQLLNHYARCTGDKAMNAVNFGKKLSVLGVKISSDRRYYRGIKLVHDEDY